MKPGLIVPHEPVSALDVSLQAGPIVERGPPAAVLHNPQHAHTRVSLDAIQRPIAEGDA